MAKRVPSGGPARTSSSSSLSGQKQLGAAVHVPSGPGAFLLTADPPSSVDELEVTALRVQNHKLAVKLHGQTEELKRAERELKKRQETDLIVRACANTLARYFDELEREAVEKASADKPQTSLADMLDSAIDDAGSPEEAEQEIAERCKALLAVVSPSLQAPTPLPSHAQELQQARLAAQRAQDKLKEEQHKCSELEHSKDQLSFMEERLKNEVLRLGDGLRATMAKLEELEAKQPATGSTSTAPAASAETAASADQSAETVDSGELARYRVLAEEREARIEALRKEVQQLDATLQELRSERLSEAFLRRAPLVQETMEANARLTAQTTSLNQRVAELQQELSAAQVARTNECRSFQDMVTKLQADTQQRLKTLEDELVAVQSERDQLKMRPPQSSANSSGGAADPSSANQEADSLVSILQTQLKQLQGELSRVRQEQQSQDIPDSVKAIVDDASKSPQEKIDALIQELANSKANENAMMEDMEVTGQSFDEVQEQNARLMKQLKEKEARDLRHLEERLRSSQVCATLTEEKQALEKKMDAERALRKAEEDAFRRLRESERKLRGDYEETTRRLFEAERQQEQQRVTAAKHEQEAAASHAQLSQVMQQVEQLRESVRDSSSRKTEVEAQLSRAEEEAKVLAERCAQLQTGSADEILEAQVEELNKKLTCPACCTRQKDTIILKCYHMFCETCVRNRLETRQRKCPQCSRQFGANDFHRAYLV